MTARLDYMATVPEAFKPLLKLSDLAHNSGLEPAIVNLIEIRASQINRCGYCLDMHTKDARSAGETEQRIYGLNAWRDTPYYNQRERLALELTEVLTQIAQNHVADEFYQRLLGAFSESELVKLVTAISTINMWNRFAITFQSDPGSYKPEHFVAQAALEKTH
ncbi:carboxymuconolactone decarboxylase family protein [Herpetosiphon giganteus]|uniref:carboxymuconolactone decarboxylase family protein n=1 Tax=Herpetosiphon giganteus TaxID=2029754 RepID=UPI00195EB6EC|nr:carboxymuconolactone decarboxylase family protein [Herpetosiphon giganteus]MBM7842573.1 AhpD family alkylhydroperoxidase [Herpetosiphon giganteus]